MSEAEHFARIQVFPVDAAGCLVEYVSHDDGMSPTGSFQAGIAADAAERAPDGWTLVSLGVYPLRNGGTAGSMFSQGGGNFATVLGATALFRRAGATQPVATITDGAAGYP